MLPSFTVHVIGSRIQSHSEILTDSFASDVHIPRYQFSTDDESLNDC